MATERITEKKALLGNGLSFAAAMWLLSRLIIAIAMLLIAPALPAPPGGSAATVGWDVFSAWDSAWYQRIATTGYEYINDGKEHSVAFFPLLPLLSRAVMTFGLPFEVAGTIVNNLAFLGALVVLYAWVEELHGKSAARWATAVLAWCPFSLYGTVIYTEGLFLLLSTAALRAFDKQQYWQVALWGALASAARPTGMALIPAFLLVAWRERRPPIAYIASLATGLGMLLYSIYCGMSFGDPLAFIHVQSAWGRESFLQGWFKIFRQVVIGPVDINTGAIKNPLHMVIVASVCAIAVLLWRSRSKLGYVKVGYGLYALWLLLWLVVGDRLIKTVMVFGGGYLLWYSRAKISRVAVAYGFFALALLLNAGRTTSAERYAYGIVSLAIALGVLLERYPRWGYAIMGFFAILLASFAVRFSQNVWVA